MIANALCDSYKRELMSGVHSAADEYRIALFTSAADLGAATEAYSATAEVVGAGYTSRGLVLAGFATGLTSGVAWVDFSDVTWPESTITARGALIYNASKEDRAVVALDFGSERTSNDGPFTLRFPDPAGPSGAIIKLS